ncbi:MAG: SGNH/GDSL hydrolase family protein [Thermoanaerobaculia bacterium]
MAKRLVALALGLAVGVLLFEGALRLLLAVSTRPEPPEMRPIPGAPPIVSSWPADPPSRQGSRPTKILVVGDSFTLGRGVALDQVYPARLAKTLRSAGHDVKVTSYSFPGWNSRAEAAALKRDLDKYAPDLLIVGHCLNDAEKVPTARATSNRPELRPWQPEGPLESSLARHSILFGRVRRAVDSIRLRPLLRDYYQELYRDNRGRRLWQSSLAALSALAAERSIPAALVVFPIFDSDPDDAYPYRNLHELVEDTGTDLGFAVLDLLPVYSGIDGRELALVPFTDPHPSVRGHDLAGQAIAHFLVERGLLGSGEPLEPTGPDS